MSVLQARCQASYSTALTVDPKLLGAQPLSLAQGWGFVPSSLQLSRLWPEAIAFKGAPYLPIAGEPGSPKVFFVCVFFK